MPGRVSRPPPRCAACSRCRRCAISRSPRRIFTTACSATCTRWSSGTSRATSTTTPATTRIRWRPGPGGNPYVAVGTFYTAADGTPDLYEYNDLPVDYDANVNIGEVPYTPPTFGGGQAPTLTRAGDRRRRGVPLHADRRLRSRRIPSAYNVPAQCQPSAAASAAAQTQGIITMNLQDVAHRTPSAPQDALRLARDSPHRCCIASTALAADAHRRCVNREQQRDRGAARSSCRRCRRS